MQCTKELASLPAATQLSVSRIKMDHTLLSRTSKTFPSPLPKLQHGQGSKSYSCTDALIWRSLSYWQVFLCWPYTRTKSCILARYQPRLQYFDHAHFRSLFVVSYGRSIWLHDLTISSAHSVPDCGCVLVHDSSSHSPPLTIEYPFGHCRLFFTTV